MPPSLPSCRRSDHVRPDKAQTLPTATFSADGRCGRVLANPIHIASRWYIGKNTPPCRSHDAGTVSA